MKLFSQKLRQRAQDLGISNAAAARRAGLVERRYANYVSGDREPDLATLVRIAKSLETTPNQLLGFEDGKESGKRNKLLARVNSAALMLPDDELDVVSVQIAALAARHKKPQR